MLSARLLETLTELLQFSDLDKSQWTQRWQELAQRQGGVYWKSLIRIWVRSAENSADKDTWQARHSDVSRSARVQAAYDRAYNELGVHRQPDGSYLCGYEGCKIVQTLKGIRTHVDVCKHLSVAQRVQRCTTVAASASSASAAGPSSRVSVPQDPPQTRRRRMTSKQPRPVAYERTCRQTSPQDFQACISFAIKETLDHYALQHCTRKYRGLHLERSSTLTDLPPPSLDSSGRKNICRFCLRQFDSSGQRVKHSSIFSCS